MNNDKQLKTLVIFILIPTAVGALSAFISMQGMELYAEVQKPALSPPAVLFPIVWTILYTLMGISSFMVYNSPESDKRTQALRVYALQLAVNFIWSPVFFNLQAYLPAFFILILLWAAAAVMTVLFYFVKPLAAYLQLPYLLWLTFAGYLNIGVYLLNK